MSGTRLAAECGTWPEAAALMFCALLLFLSVCLYVWWCSK